MIEAFVPVLTAIGNVLTAYNDLVVEPSKKNLEKISEQIQDLDEAHQRFKIQMSKAEIQLQQGQVEKLRNEISLYQSSIDENFLQVIIKGKKIIEEVQLCNISELFDSTHQLILMSQELFELWQKLEQAIILNNPRHIIGFFRYVRNKTNEYAENVKGLAHYAGSIVAKKAGLYKYQRFMSSSINDSQEHAQYLDSDNIDIHRQTTDDESMDNSQEQEQNDLDQYNQHLGFDNFGSYGHTAAG